MQSFSMFHAASKHLDVESVKAEKDCVLTLQKKWSVCPVRIKHESEVGGILASDVSQAETFPQPRLNEMKKESIEIGALIKKEQLDDLTLVSKMTYRREERLPAGLIPPVEMEDECDIEWKENEYLDKKVISSKVKLGGNVGKKSRGKRKNTEKYKSHEKAGDNRTSFKMHSRMHGGDSFRCETCEKDFKRSDLLTDHMKVHKRKRPYSCDQCGMMFAKPAYLKIHLRRHAGERAFPCDQCDKRFFDKYDLKVHQRDHTGERPYVCLECGKSFKRIYILNKHKRTHSKEKPFQCDVCGKAYGYVYSYRLHMKEHSS